MARRNRGSGGFSNFLSGLIGAVLGGFLVFSLLGSSLKTSDNNKKEANTNSNTKKIM